MYEGLSKPGNLMSRKGKGVRKSPNLCDIINKWPLSYQGKLVFVTGLEKQLSVDTSLEYISLS